MEVFMARTNRRYAFHEFDSFDKELFKEAKEAVENDTATSWELHTYRYYLYKCTADSSISITLPRHFRKEVNKRRRARDKQEVYKAVHIVDYEELCSDWNCKDNESWGYW